MTRTSPLHGGRSRRLVWESLVVGSLLLAGGLWFWLDPPPNPPAEPQNELPRPVPVAAGLQRPKPQALVRPILAPGMPATGEPEHQRATTTSVALAADGRLALAGGGDSVGRLWDLADGRLVRSLGQPEMTWARALVAFSADGKSAVVARTLDNRVQRWRLSDGSLEGTFNCQPSGWSLACSFSADGRWLLVGGVEPITHDPDVTTELRQGVLVLTRPDAIPAGRRTLVASLLFQTDLSGTRLFDLETNRVRPMRASVRLWDVAKGQPVRTLLAEPGWSVEVAALSPDGKLALAGKRKGAEEELMLWDVASGAKLRTFEKRPGFAMALAFARDGQRVLTGDTDQRPRLCDVTTGRVLRTLEQHRSGWPILCVGFSPDGKRAFSGTGSFGGPKRLIASALGDFKVWDVDSGRPVWDGGEGQEAVLTAAFTADGKQVVAGTGGPQVWDLATGKVVRTLQE